ncbi:MAG: 2-dehydropantoate 2-reductase, partial [Betaproteobacteria bacterium]
MKIAVVGAGAIGGYVGARLSLAGKDVTFIARGANLAAIRARGLELIEEDGTARVASGARAFEHMREAGTHDVVLLTVKAHQVAPVAPEIAYLCHADTAIVTMQNGIPWWYFQNYTGEYAGHPVASADPTGTTATHIEPRRIIGSVVYPAAQLTAPGIVQVVEGNRFTLGELDGGTTPRLQSIAAALIDAGFKAPITNDIRSE